MGYYTSYTLDVYGYDPISQAKSSIELYDEEKLEALASEIDRMNVFESGGDVKGEFFAVTKWYDHENDMILLSHRFPDFLFCLHGEGDEPEDLWNDYYVGGAMQSCPAKIIYDDFEPSKLNKVDIDDPDEDTYSYEK